ncbi:MAG TPA: D-2-hydroxyacid dehydrogenase [Patescibacteria group bacterium]|nr:D-2-hydroxyacid dehydrogenase [Patescibacteria group bacterium]
MDILIIGSSDPHKTIANFSQKHIDEIKKVVPDATINLTLDKNGVEKLIPDADILLYTVGSYPLSDIPFDKAIKLKWVQTTSAGVTDIAKALKDTDILLTNASGTHPIPISEQVLCYMLMFAKRANITLKNQLTKKQWIRDFDLVKGFELSGSTVGIIGFGNIGKQIAKLSKAVGMKVVVLEHNKNINDKNDNDTKNIVDTVFTSPDDVLKVSDFVVDCLPLTDETLHYFTLDLFKKMKQSAYFINIGRGKTVAEKDLILALKDKVIAGAALDVTDVEPLPQDSPLWDFDNVIITPHSSSWTPKYPDRVTEIFVNNLKLYLDNKPMKTLVDKDRGY